MSTDLLPSTKLLQGHAQTARVLVMRQLNSLGQFIKTIRQGKRMTQMELTKAIGLEASVSISRWEHGIDPVPHRHYRNLAKALNVSLDKLLALAQQDHPEHVTEFHTLEKQLGVEVPTKTDPSIGLWTLRRDLRDHLKQLTHDYPRATEQDLLEAAVEFFIANAKRSGLDGHWHPNPTPSGASPQSPSQGIPKTPSGHPLRRSNTRR